VGEQAAGDERDQPLAGREPVAGCCALDAAAARDGVSVNTWLVQVLARAAEPRPSSGGSRRRLTGYGRS